MAKCPGNATRKAVPVAATLLRKAGPFNRFTTRLILPADVLLQSSPAVYQKRRKKKKSCSIYSDNY